MQYTHKEGEAAVSFVSNPIEPLQFASYYVFESGENYVVVGHKKEEKIKMQFYENCIFHKTVWKIDEYFCKSK